VMVVTPLRDGMNLVAKEFIASRSDGDGVLILSEFAGASTELTGAIAVNPFDPAATAAAMAAALDMPSAARRDRMGTLRARVMEWDADKWFETFLQRIDQAVLHRTVDIDQRRCSEELFGDQARFYRLRLLLDYDGTLVPFTNRPEEASPDRELLDLLGQLAQTPGVSVHIITGRPKASIEAFLGDLNLNLHAEHGLWSRSAGARAWTSNSSVSTLWMSSVCEILRHFTAVVPGSFVEQKDTSLAWHFRAAKNADHALLRSRELEELLNEFRSSSGLDVLRGNCVIEIRPRQLHKGLVAEVALKGRGECELVVAAGDDRTDEDLFQALPVGCRTVHVGTGPTSAEISISDFRELRRELWRLVSARRRSPLPIVEGAAAMERVLQ